MKNKLRDLPPEYRVGFLREFDQRTALFQRLNGIFQSIVADCGGHEVVTHAKLALIERAVFLESVIQGWEEMVARDPVENENLMGRWIQAVNSLTGIYKVIGVERKVQKTLDLKAYVGDLA
jgi:hypothetical protein